MDRLELAQTLAIIITTIAVFWQLYQTRKRHKLDRLVEWKSAIQGINGLILDHPETFIPVLYPKVENAAEAKRLTATYASLHALEIIYSMRKGEEYPLSQLRAFLKSYVSGKDFRELWKNEAYHVAFTTEFQEELSGVFKELDRETGDRISPA